MVIRIITFTHDKSNPPRNYPGRVNTIFIIYFTIISVKLANSKAASVKFNWPFSHGGTNAFTDTLPDTTTDKIACCFIAGKTSQSGSGICVFYNCLSGSPVYQWSTHTSGQLSTISFPNKTQIYWALWWSGSSTQWLTYVYVD